MVALQARLGRRHGGGPRTRQPHVTRVPPSGVKMAAEVALSLRQCPPNLLCRSFAEQLAFRRQPARCRAKSGMCAYHKPSLRFGRIPRRQGEQQVVAVQQHVRQRRDAALGLPPKKALNRRHGLSTICSAGSDSTSRGKAFRSVRRPGCNVSIGCSRAETGDCGVCKALRSRETTHEHPQGCQIDADDASLD